MEELSKLGVREIAAGVREKKWDAARVMRSALRTIDALEPKVRAWEHLDPADAMGRAESARNVSGPLAGVPIAVKDIIDVAGMPTRFGSRIYADAKPAAETAQSIQALERAGAIVVGKTVTTEFAYYSPGKTRNPWNPTHTPGGSSQGSAASVACGMVPGAIGTQTNGSVVRPAAFCGVVGFKPTLGIVSNHATMDPWPTLDHTGVFARSVADAALLAATIAEGGAIAAEVKALDRAPRLAVVRTPVWEMAEAPQREMLARNAEALKSAGADVRDFDLPAEYNDAHSVQRMIMAFEAARHFGALQKEHRDLMSAQINALLDEGAAVAEADYRAALDRTNEYRRQFSRVMGEFDAFITPPAAGEAPATLEQTGNPAFCTIWTLLGVPAISIPVGRGPAGMPLGLQIVGRAREDDRTLAIAAWCEKVTGYR